MDERGVLIMLSSTFGTVYRSVFTTDLDTVKKFMVSLVLSTICGFIIIAYCKENEVKHYMIVIVSLLAGLLSHNMAQVIIGVGGRSEKTIIENTAKYIDQKSKNLLDLNNSQSHDTSHESKSNDGAVSN